MGEMTRLIDKELANGGKVVGIVLMRKGEIMFKVPNGQDPYSAIGKYIRDHITAIEDIIAVIKINEVETNQLFMVNMKEEDYFVWKSDWWEGEEDVTLIDFFPVSEAQRADQNVQSTDTISRRAAIDALCVALYEYEDKTEKQFQVSEDLDIGDWIEHRIFVQNMNDIDMQTILNLPSAQPDRKKGKWIKKMLVTETEKYISYDPEWYCACCGTKYDSHIAKIVNFCYVCGADMREGEKK